MQGNCRSLCGLCRDILGVCWSIYCSKMIFMIDIFPYSLINLIARGRTFIRTSSKLQSWSDQSKHPSTVVDSIGRSRVPMALWQIYLGFKKLPLESEQFFTLVPYRSTNNEVSQLVKWLDTLGWRTSSELGNMTIRWATPVYYTQNTIPIWTDECSEHRIFITRCLAVVNHHGQIDCELPTYKKPHRNI